MDGEIRTTLSEHANAFHAGYEAHGDAHYAYASEVRRDWDARVPSVADAFDAWSARAVLPDGDWDAAERAFVAGWERAEDAR